MALFPTSAGMAGHAARRAADEVTPWIRWLARLGYAAKGVVYLVIGGLAVRAALTPVQDPQGSSGALRSIQDAPFGRGALAVIAVGLAGYVLWRLVQAIRDPENKGTGAKGIATRVGYLISGVLYGAVALEAARLLMGTGGGGGDGQRADHWTAMVMEQPLGRWIIGAVGAGIIAFGLYEWYRAFGDDLRKRMDLTDLGGDARTRVIRLGRLGLFARGVVFGVIGWLLIQAALQYDPQEAIGLEGALAALRAQSHGPWVLGLVALGLVAYGLWQLAKARFRSIHPA